MTKKPSKKLLALIAALFAAIVVYLSQDDAVAPAPESDANALAAPDVPAALPPAPSSSAGG